MGRKASCTVSFGGQSGAGRLLLEATGIIVRGAVKGRVARTDIQGFVAIGADLVIKTSTGPLRARLGEKEAALWVKALAKPVPSLADKLGIKPGVALLTVGEVTDPALLAALEGHEHSGKPLLLLAELHNPDDFASALGVLLTYPEAAFWGATRKGKSAFTDAMLRQQMRAAGYNDSKSCAVSDLWTATRYSRPCN